jgi:hypothetical protein
MTRTNSQRFTGAALLQRLLQDFLGVAPSQELGWMMSEMNCK